MSGFCDDAVAEILRDLDHGVARDADEDRGGEIRRVDDAVAHDEEALARAVRDGPLGGEHDRLVVAGAVRLADGEHRVDVDAGRLRDVRDDVRPDALPARDLGADAVLHPVLAEVRAPRPRHDRDVDGIALRRDAELAVAEERDRTEVTRRQLVGADHDPTPPCAAPRRSTASPCRAAARTAAAARGGRRAGRRTCRGPSRRRGFLRTRPSRSAGRASQHERSRRPSRRARRSSKSSSFRASRSVPSLGVR